MCQPVFQCCCSCQTQLVLLFMQSDEDLDRYIKNTLHSGNALVGTCAMGMAPEKGAVVDADLKVYGVRGLRVADSSVIPNIPGQELQCWLCIPSRQEYGACLCLA